MLTAHYPTGRPLPRDADTGGPGVISWTLAPAVASAASVAAPVALAAPVAYAVVASGVLDWSPEEWGKFFAVAAPVATVAGLGIRKFVKWAARLVVDSYVDLITRIENNRRATVAVGDKVTANTAAAVTQAATQAAASAVTQAAAEAVAPAVAKAIDASSIPTSDEQHAAYAAKTAAALSPLLAPMVARLVEAELAKQRAERPLGVQT